MTTTPSALNTAPDDADQLTERCFDQRDINRIRPAVASEFRYLMTKISNAEASHLETIDERDRLKEEIGKLRAALELFAKMADGHEDALDCATIIVCLGDLRKARAALQGEGGKL